MYSYQRPVATRTRDILQKTILITRCVEGYPEGLSPKLIAVKTGLNVNTVKSILPKIKNMTSPIRGLYKVVKEGDSPRALLVELSDWNFHNLVLKTDLHSHWNSALVAEQVFEWGLVRGVFSISKSGSACLRIDTDYPINVSSLCLLNHIFNSILREYSIPAIAQRDLLVTTIEFNKDFKNLRLDGVQSISLDNLVEQFKIYQKQSGLRVEHKTKIPLSVETIVDVLSNNPNSIELNMKLSQNKQQLERLTKATSTNTDIMLKIIDKLNKGEI